MQQIGRILRYPVGWMGGWLPFLLLVLVIIAVVVGLTRERTSHPPLPPQAQNVATNINTGNLRQTSFRVAGSIEDVRAFYRQELPGRGWRYCGTQATERCTNMLNASDEQIDVYRRADDGNYTGSTIEIWPIPNADGLTYVTVFETSPR